MHINLINVTDKVKANCEDLFPIKQGEAKKILKTTPFLEEPYLLTFRSAYIKIAEGDFVKPKFWREEEETIIHFYMECHQYIGDRCVKILAELEVDEIDLHFLDDEYYWLDSVTPSKINYFLENAEYMNEDLILNNLNVNFVPNFLRDYIDDKLSELKIVSAVRGGNVTFSELNSNRVFKDDKDIGNRPYITMDKTKILIRCNGRDDITIRDLINDPFIVVAGNRLLYSKHEPKDMLKSIINETADMCGSEKMLKDIIFHQNTKFRMNTINNKLIAILDAKQVSLIDKFKLGSWINFKDTVDWLYINTLSINELRPVSIVKDVSWFVSTNKEYVNGLIGEVL